MTRVFRLLKKRFITIPFCPQAKYFHKRFESKERPEICFYEPIILDSAKKVNTVSFVFGGWDLFFEKGRINFCLVFCRYTKFRSFCRDGRPRPSVNTHKICIVDLWVITTNPHNFILIFHFYADSRGRLSLLSCFD